MHFDTCTGLLITMEPLLSYQTITNSTGSEKSGHFKIMQKMLEGKSDSEGANTH